MVPWQGRIKRYCGMKGMKRKEKGRSAIGMYIRNNIADIIQKCNDIRIADIMPNRSYIRSTADITALSAIRPLFKNYKCSNRFCNIVWRNEEDNVNPKVNYRGDMRE
jgi:hypothetical protein